MSTSEPPKVRRHEVIYHRWRDVMPCHLSVQDRKLRIIEANDSVVRDFGECVGEYCFKIYKKTDKPCPDCPVLATFEDGKVHTGEQTVILDNGEIADMVVTSAPIFNDKGEVTEVVEMCTNVTEVKTLKKKLAESRREYKQLFESVPCYICVLDRNLEILESNNLYRTDFDVQPGAHCFEACKDRDSACVECLVQKTFEDGQIHYSEETLTTRDGKQLYLIVYSMPIKNGDGEISSVMEVFTDITAVKMLERQLTLMGRAVAGMAHRIKNILMGLEGSIFVYNTGTEMNDEKMMAEGWEMVERNVGRVSRLVLDLLYCSKKRMPEFEEGVCPQNIAKEVADLFRSRMADEGVELVLELSKPPYIGTFDTDSLLNMLNNLVANAFDACRFDLEENKARHRVYIRCNVDKEGTTVFEVEDDGAGIPEEVKKKVFEEFFSTKGTEGTGVGLLVVQKVAEEHGGAVSFESEAGKGTVFRVTIPARTK